MVIGEGKELDVLCLPLSQLHLFRKQIQQHKHAKVIVLEDTVGQALEIKAELYPIMPLPQYAIRSLAGKIALKKVALLHSSWEYAPLFFDILSEVRLSYAVTADVDAKAFSNIIANAYQVDKIIDLTSLQGAFEAVPAVIVGGGPSLSSLLPALKQLQGSALVMAGGAALAALAGSEVPCHIAAGIDKDPNYGLFLHGQAFETPFFYQERFCSHQLSLVSASTYLLPANEGFAVEQWLANTRSVPYSSGDGGWTVSTYLVALATHLGCNPIILVGVDLNACNPVYDKLVPPSSEVLGAKEDWHLASKWLTHWIDSHQATTFIKPKDAKKALTVLKPCHDLYNLVHARLSLARYIDAKESSVRAANTLLASIKTSLSLVERMLELAQQPQGDKKSCYHLFDYELSQELAYDLILAPSWQGVSSILEEVEVDLISVSTRKLLWYQTILQRHIHATL